MAYRQLPYLSVRWSKLSLGVRPYLGRRRVGGLGEMSKSRLASNIETDRLDDGDPHLHKVLDGSRGGSLSCGHHVAGGQLVPAQLCIVG